MDKIYTILIFIIIAFIGLYVLKKKLNNIKNNEIFSAEFLAELKNYIESNGGDTKAYSWLLSCSNKMQYQMGQDGIYGHYKPPYSNYSISNYPIILNMLPELRNSFEEGELFNKVSNQYASALQESILRHMGSVEEALNEQSAEIKNPFIWLREGVRVIIAFPISILNWLGIITKLSSKRIISNTIFKVISGVIALLGLLSTLMTLVLGWEKFYEIILKNIS